MKIKQTILSIGLVLFATIATPIAVFADGSCGTAAYPVQTSIITCKNVTNTGTDPTTTAIWSLLLMAINILTAGVGVAAVGGIVYGSIMYASAGGSPDQVKKAREIITNVVIGIIAYALMYSLLNFLIPGGLFAK
jgi:hypothetical protein